MKAKQVLTYIISLGIGVVLFYGAFSFIDDKEALWETMRSARWEGIAASFVMGYLAIVSRGLRWGILLEPLGARQARPEAYTLWPLPTSPTRLCRAAVNWHGVPH